MWGVQRSVCGVVVCELDFGCLGDFWLYWLLLFIEIVLNFNEERGWVGGVSRPLFLSLSRFTHLIIFRLFVGKFAIVFGFINRCLLCF